MIYKYLLLLGLIFSYLPFSKYKDGLKRYYFLTVIMFLVRELNMGPFGDIVPASIMTTVLFLIVLTSSKNVLGGWQYYTAYLLFSLLLGLLDPWAAPKAMFWVFTLFVVMAQAVMPRALFKSAEDVDKLMKCIIIACFVFSITTIIAYLGFVDGTVLISVAPTDDRDIHASRVYGITASNLVQIISIISIVFIPWLNIKRKWVEWGIIGVFVFAALVTLKRMSFIAMAASMAYYLYIQYKRKNYRTVVIMAVMLFIFISFFGASILYRFNIAGFGGHKVTDHSTQSRFMRSSIAYDAFIHSPIFGMGAGYVIYVHNGFMEVLGNCGILGILTIFLRFIPPLKSIKKLNPWAVASLLFVLTCLSLESAINSVQMMSFLGMFLGGYFASKQLKIQYK